MPRSLEVLLARSAMAVLVVHALDDAIVHREPGVPFGQHLLAAAAAIAGGGLAILAYPRLRPGLRAGLAALFAVLGLANGAMHVAHIALDGVSRSDVTGVLAVAAALLLLALAAWVPIARRSERPTTPAGRWGARGVAVPAVLLAVVLVVPVAVAVVDSHMPREAVPAPPAGYRAVGFDTSDGLRLQGWFHPSRNGATVLVVHGGGGDRTGAVRHAQVLARHGYGILLYDARGRGRSEGSPSGYGWGWRRDVKAALAYLARRDDVDPSRIGGLGLSTGADVLLEVAPERPVLRAVVADGAAAMSWQDTRRLGGTPVDRAMSWVMFQAIGLFTGAERPHALEERVAAMRAPLLLISAGRDLEHDASVRYARAAGGPVEHWNLPDAGHTRGLRQRPAEYERRVVAFLDHALHPRVTRLAGGVRAAS